MPSAAHNDPQAMAQHPEDDRAAPPAKAQPSPPHQPNGHTHTPSQVTAQERYDPRHDERPPGTSDQQGAANGPHAPQTGTETSHTQQPAVSLTHTSSTDGLMATAQQPHAHLPDRQISAIHTDTKQTNISVGTQPPPNTQPPQRTQEQPNTIAQSNAQQQPSIQQDNTQSLPSTQQQPHPTPPPAPAQPPAQPMASAPKEAPPPVGQGHSEPVLLAERVAAAQARQRELEGRLAAVAAGLRRQQATQLQASLRHQVARHTRAQAPPPPRPDQQAPARTRTSQQPPSEAEAKPPPAAEQPKEEAPREAAKEPAGPVLTGRARRTARKIEGAAELLQRIGDDSATESSSGESGDELDPDTDLGRNLNKAWEHYHEQRADVGWRWGWLGLQIAELDRHIACYEAGLKALRAAKRPLPTLPQPTQGCARLLPCASAGRHRTLWKDPPPAPHRLPMLGPEAPSPAQARLGNIDPCFHPVLSRPYEAPPPLLFSIPPLPPPPPPIVAAPAIPEPSPAPAPPQPEVPPQPSSPPEDERPIKLLVRQGSKETKKAPTQRPAKKVPVPARSHEGSESGSYRDSQSDSSSSSDDDRPLKRRRVSSVSRIGPEDGPDEVAKRIRRASSSESVRPGSMAPLSLLRRRSKYDINNIVIPANVVPVSRIEKISYKEILTPSWRTLTPKTSAPSTPSAHPATPQSTGPTTPAGVVEESEGSSEDTSDEAYAVRHAALAHKEQLRYQAFVNRNRRHRNSQDKSARASISSQGAASDGPPTPAPVAPAPPVERPPLPQWSPRRFDVDWDEEPRQEAAPPNSDQETKCEPRQHSKPHSRQESRSVSPDSTGGGKDKDEEVGWEIVRKKAPGQNVLVLRVAKPH